MNREIAQIILIFTKGDRKLPSNFRGINLLRTTTKIIKDKIKVAAPFVIISSYFVPSLYWFVPFKLVTYLFIEISLHTLYLSTTILFFGGGCLYESTCITLSSYYVLHCLSASWFWSFWTFPPSLSLMHCLLLSYRTAILSSSCSSTLYVYCSFYDCLSVLQKVCTAISNYSETYLCIPFHPSCLFLICYSSISWKCWERS